MESRTHLIRIEYECTDISVAFALDLLDGFGCRHAGDDDVALLLEIEDEWETERRVSSE